MHCASNADTAADYLGDAIQDIVVSCYLYYHLPDATPGALTLWRQRFSRKATQAVLAYYTGLHKALCHESPGLFKVFSRYCDAPCDSFKQANQWLWQRMCNLCTIRTEHHS